MSWQEITVTFPADAHVRSYPIVIDDGPDAQLRFATRMRELFAARTVCILTDDNVARLHGERYRAALPTSRVLVVRQGEAHKTLIDAGELGQKLSEAGVDRQGVIVALGGGVIGDLAGFVAAIYQRGIDYVQVPTTLMAQVDSSVGGKTAVNLPSGKNLLGAFHQPRLVYTDLSTLQTLPHRDISAGLAELVKHCLLADEKLLVSLEANADSLLATADRSAFASLIAQSCAFKARVVAADERETMQTTGPGRAQLNFGHTIGHAIEAASHHTETPLRHGEAVALGMIAAAEIGERLQLGMPGLADRLRRLLLRFGLSTDLQKWLTPEKLDDVLDRVGRDKKRTLGVTGTEPGINFILLTAIGRPIVTWLALRQLREILQRFAGQ